ncbi:MAG: FmdB family zinc ribbon protein [Pirellulaceae bacterium]
MPTYDYECNSCGHEFELFQSISDSPRKKCPECGRLRLRRLFGTGSAIVFKGTGFYQTDYRSDSYKQGAKAEKKASSTASSDKDKSGNGKGEKAKSSTATKEKAKTNA